ncbi:hypothetical protein [Phenylobacterium immobile]|uniref:hypothetical protein n=1 Tax=Phenylobacterium immobile TaxID=21 RepID=UPI000B804F0C|nr:hypothetical protein [Phenylobacterium immobile]
MDTVLDRIAARWLDNQKVEVANRLDLGRHQDRDVRARHLQQEAMMMSVTLSSRKRRPILFSKSRKSETMKGMRAARRKAS